MRAAPLLCVLVLLAGCSTGGPKAVVPILRACVVPTTASVEPADDGEGWQGYDVDLLEHLATGLDEELQLVDVTFDEAVAGQPTGERRCELVAGAFPDDGTIVAPLRASAPYRSEVLVLLGDATATGDDVGAVGVVAGDGTTDAAGGLAGDVRELPSLLDATAALRAGTVEALLVPLADVPAATEGADVGVVTTVAGEGDVVLLLAATVDDERRAAIDDALAAWRTGDAAAAADRWFGPDEG